MSTTHTPGAVNHPQPWPSAVAGRQEPRKARRWPWVLLGLAIGLLVGVAMGSAGQAPQAVAVAPAPYVAPTPTTQAPVVVAAPVTQAPVTQPPAAAPAATFSDGVYQVGAEMAPGKYKTAGPSTDGLPCYYARLKTGDGTLGDILANNLSQGQMTVTVKRTDGMFETSGCLPWTKVS